MGRGRSKLERKELMTLKLDTHRNVLNYLKKPGCGLSTHHAKHIGVRLYLSDFGHLFHNCAVPTWPSINVVRIPIGSLHNVNTLTCANCNKDYSSYLPFLKLKYLMKKEAHGKS